jgi:hypothetical protein
MTRAFVFGPNDLRTSIAALGLVAVESDDADIVVVDLRDAEAVAKASRAPRSLPRVVVADPGQVDLVVASGFARDLVATTSEAAAIGPLIAAALPRERRRATRSILVTAARGGVGRSLLVANVARRLAAKRTVLAVDATGSPGLSSWLGAAPAGWRELEGLEQELTSDHVAVVASEIAPQLRMLGGPPTPPTPVLCRAAVRAGLDLVETVLVDGPNLCEMRTRDLMSLVDRVLVLTYDDPISLAALEAADVPDAAWLVASQSRATSLGGRDVMRALPRAEPEVAGAAAGPRAVAGALGRAYDDLTELLALDGS